MIELHFIGFILFQNERILFFVLSYITIFSLLKRLYVAFTFILQNHGENIIFYGQLLLEGRLNTHGNFNSSFGQYSGLQFD